MTVAVVRRLGRHAYRPPSRGTTARAAHGGGAGMVSTSHPVTGPA